MRSWQEASKAWQFAYGQPASHGVIKSQPEDFRVTELLDFEPTGEGEHVWLLIEKRLENSDAVAKQLARHANVAYRDVGYAGRKDYHAVTQQWFSVWLPGVEGPDWSQLASDRLTILAKARHSRKLKTGAHRGNRFAIRINELSGNKADLQTRLVNVQKEGVPNYFGLQRFGRNFSNLDAFLAGFSHKKKDRRQAGLLMSAARSWLYNETLSLRVASGDWNKILLDQAVMLQGSSSYFINQSTSDDDLAQRLLSGDVHPGIPLFAAEKPDRGRVSAQIEYANLPAECAPLIDSLQGSGLRLEYRSSRCLPHAFRHRVNGESVMLEFELPKGQFATAVLRELIQAEGV